MKKMMLILACVFCLATKAAADNYQPITREQLPQKAQTFLSSYFPNAKVSLVRRDIDLAELSYDVIFTDGSKVEFDRRGYWKEVDCINQALPAGIVPANIEKAAKAQYPEAAITKIEVDREGYEVKLNNRRELSFNRKMQLVDID